MATMIETYEKCQNDCDKGRIYGGRATMRSCPNCNGKGYTNHIITVSDLYDMLEKIREQKRDKLLAAISDAEKQ